MNDNIELKPEIKDSKDEHKERPKIDYTEKEIKLAIDINKSIYDILDFLIYIKEERKSTMSLILIETTIKNFEDYLVKSKRDTDIIEIINKKEGIYFILCQETTSNGGYKFLERVITPFREMNNVCTCASLLTICQDTNNLSTKKIIFKLLDNFIGLTAQPEKWKKCQIAFSKI